MRCILCKSELPLSQKESPRAVCKSCSIELSKTPVPKSKRKIQSRKPDAVLASSNESNVHSATQTQSLRSARAVTKAWRNQVAQNATKISHKTFRIDSAHSIDSDVDETSHEFIPLESDSGSIAAARNATSFGLLVFLVGQACILGGFLSGNFAAWNIGMLFSVGGVTISLLSVNEALRRLETRMERTMKAGATRQVKKTTSVKDG